MLNDLNGIDSKVPRSYDRIETEAAGIRRTFGFSLVAPLDMRTVFEFFIDDLQVPVGPQKIPVRHGVEKLASEALTKWNSEDCCIDLLLSEDWYQWLQMPHPRAFFTVAHELGHAVLHPGILMALNDLSIMNQAALHRGAKSHPPYRDTEWQANAFASALLMPADGVKSLSKAGKLPSDSTVAKHFGVSQQAAFYRLETLRRGQAA